LAIVLVALRVHAEPVLHDARDSYSLLDRHPVNRQLFEQLDTEEEKSRLTRDWEHVALLGDVSATNQFNLKLTDDKPRFHGYAIADTYASVRPISRRLAVPALARSRSRGKTNALPELTPRQGKQSKP
jgi:hypothetical protein